MKIFIYFEKIENQNVYNLFKLKIKEEYNNSKNTIEKLETNQNLNCQELESLRLEHCVIIL